MTLEALLRNNTTLSWSCAAFPAQHPVHDRMAKHSVGKSRSMTALTALQPNEVISWSRRRRRGLQRIYAVHCSCITRRTDTARHPGGQTKPRLTRWVVGVLSSRQRNSVQVYRAIDSPAPVARVQTRIVIAAKERRICGRGQSGPTKHSPRNEAIPRIS
jgi:hypothetical protein